MRVLNKYRDPIPPDAVNIMRPSPLGNPFKIGVHGDRDEVVDKHMAYARERIAKDPEFAALVRGLRGHDVVCCCAPRRCHGDNYVILCDELWPER